MKRYRKWAAVLAALCMMGTAGCASQTSDVPSEQPGSEGLTEPVSQETQEIIPESSREEAPSGSRPGGKETQPESTEETLPDDPDTFVQQKIIVATDIHYLAEELAGNRCQSFMSSVESGDGRVLQYGWEILDAFIDDVVEQKPDLVILTGDLTMNGEKQSHEELAQKLETLSENGIEVAVIPGNHDINNPYARKFTSDGTVKTDSITADEFAQIYSDFG